MEDKIKSINSLIKAFETRNEILHEEIKKNEEAIKKMKNELFFIEEEKNTKTKNNN